MTLHSQREQSRIVFDAAVVATVAAVVDTHTADAAAVAATDAQAAVDVQHNSLLAALDAQAQVAVAVGGSVRP